MNRLKCVFGIQVHQRIPSNAIFSKSHSKGAYKRNQPDFHGLKSPSLLTCSVKRFNELRRCHCTGQTRNGIAATQQQESVERHRNFTQSSRKPHSGKRHTVRHNERLTDSTKDGKNGRFHSSKVNFNEKEPRSYARMIQCYNESMYDTNGYGMRKGPFTSATVVSLKLKHSNLKIPERFKKDSGTKGIKSVNANASGLNVFSQDMKLSSEASTTGYVIQYKSTPLINSIVENDVEKPSSSYARMIQKYSNWIGLGVENCKRSGNVVPKRNVSTKFNKIQAVLLEGKDVGVDPLPSEVLATDTCEMRADTKLEQADVKDQREDLKENESQVAAGVTTESKSKEKWALQSTNEPAYWLDRVVSAHKKSTVNKQIASENLSINREAKKKVQSATLTSGSNNVNSNVTQVSPKMEQEHAKSIQDTLATNRPSNPISEYIKRGPSRSNPTPQSSSQSPTAVANSPTKQPQIELRMTPSQNESVVAINVDEQAGKTAGAPKRDQLSVVISSKKNTAAGTAEVSSANTDFGSMHVSISESTVPVKQIEFSINGKPVSELKSILTRADKLDVVSSLDKVEIRIPSKSDAAMSNEQTRNIPSAATKSAPVLNLQIAAKFNEPRYRNPRGYNVKAATPQVAPAVSPAPTTPRQPPAPPTPPSPSLPPKPSRPQNLFVPSESSPSDTKVVKDVNILNVTDAKDSENVNRIEDIRIFPVDKRQAADKEKKNVHFVTKTDLLTTKPDEDVRQRTNSNVSLENTSQLSSTSNQESNQGKVNEPRTPTKAIPWWSSESCFTKIKKADDVAHNVSAFDGFFALENNDFIKVVKADEQKFNPVSNMNNSPNVVEKTGSSSKVEENKASRIKIQENKDHIKLSSGTELKPKSGTRLSRFSKSRSGKRNKYRTRHNARAEQMTTKKHSDVTTVTAVQPLHAVKYVPVTPQTANLENKSEEKMSIVNMSKKKNDSKSGEIPKKENPSTGKTNVQKTDTVLKEKENVGESVNKSGNVSAKPKSSSSAKVGFGSNKDGSGKQGGGNKPQEKGLPAKEDPRIKEILKSMKPIEKRKDGTLIDYGVMVPSRKPSGKVRQIPRIQGKISTDIAAKVSAAEAKGKMKDPKNSSSAKKRQLPEAKTTKNPTNVARSQPTVPIKKLGRSAVPNIKREKQIPTEKMSSLKPGIDKKDVKDAKTPIPNIRQSTDSAKVNPPYRRSLTPPGETPLFVPKVSPKTTDTAEKSTLSDKVKTTPPKSSTLSQAREKKESKSSPKLVEQKTAPSEGTVPPPSPPKILEKVQKNDTSSSNTGTTGTAPLKGTINYRPLDKKDDAGGSSKVNQDKKAKSEQTKQGKDNLAKSIENKDSGKTGHNNPSKLNMLKSQNSDIKTTIGGKDNRNSICSSEEENALLKTDVERPEKVLLYSSWLQQFKDKLDDDKVGS